MNRIFSTLMMCFVLATGLAAQDSRPVVLVDDFKVTSAVPQEKYGVAEAMRNEIIASLNKTGRFHVIDATTNEYVAGLMAKRAAEQTSESQLDRDLMSSFDDDTKQQIFKQLNVTHIMQGVIAGVSASRKKVEKTYSYDAAVGASISIIDLSTNEATPLNLNLTSGLLSACQTESAAYMACRKSVYGKINKLIQEKFPLEGQIVDVRMDRKKKYIDEVYINVGKSAGVVKNQRFDVMKIETIAGESCKTKIAVLKVKEVKSGKISGCSITKNKKDLSKVYKALEDGQKLLVISRSNNNLTNKLGGFLKSQISL